MRPFGLTWVAVAVAALGAAQTSPKEQFGKDLGDDYFLANYAQLTEYWRKLDRESDRLTPTRSANRELVWLPRRDSNPN